MFPIVTLEKHTIVELDVEKSPRVTLKNKVEFSGVILGPLLKEFYILPGKIPIPVRKDKTFSIEVPLRKGKNRIEIVAVHQTGEVAREEFIIERKELKEPVKLSKVAFRKIGKQKIEGEVGLGIKKLWIQKKEVPIEGGKFSFEYVFPREGKFTLDFRALDEVGKFHKLKKEVFVDNSPPRIDIVPPPRRTSLKEILLEGKIKEISPFEVFLFPRGSIEGIDPVSGKFYVKLPLRKGKNRFQIIARDILGNTSSRRIHIEYDPEAPPLERDPSAEKWKEIEELKKEIKRLKALLKTRIPGEGFALYRFPDIPALVEFPIPGRLGDYRKVAKFYYGEDEGLLFLIEKLNLPRKRGKQRVLLPTPQLFSLLLQIPQLEELLPYVAYAYHRGKNDQERRKLLLELLLTRGLLVDISRREGGEAWQIKNGIVFLWKKERRASFSSRTYGRSYIQLVFEKRRIVFY